MPNWCYNKVKISPINSHPLADKLKEAVKDGQDLFCQFVPQPKFDDDQAGTQAGTQTT